MDYPTSGITHGATGAVHESASSWLPRAAGYGVDCAARDTVAATHGITHVADGAILAGCVHRLKDQQQRVAIGRVV